MGHLPGKAGPTSACGQSSEGIPEAGSRATRTQWPGGRGGAAQSRFPGQIDGALLPPAFLGAGSHPVTRGLGSCMAGLLGHPEPWGRHRCGCLAFILQVQGDTFHQADPGFMESFEGSAGRSLSWGLQEPDPVVSGSRTSPGSFRLRW